MGRIFERAEPYLDQLDPGVFVEIGTSRGGDDGSTANLAEWAVRLGTNLTTVDMDPQNCLYVERMKTPNTTIVNSTGEDYLNRRMFSERPINLLYLDNFDWDWHPDKTEDFVIHQQKRYQSLGLEMNNVNSQRAHLAQAIAAMGHMTAHSLIICDDTWYNQWWGHYSGKSGAAVPYLLNQGYEILETEEEPVYGTILGRGIVKK